MTDLGKAEHVLGLGARLPLDRPSTSKPSSTPVPTPHHNKTTLEAKYVASSETTRAAQWLAKLHMDTAGKPGPPLPCLHRLQLAHWRISRRMDMGNGGASTSM